jgi:hypothetical protein
VHFAGILVHDASAHRVVWAAPPERTEPRIWYVKLRKQQGGSLVQGAGALPCPYREEEVFEFKEEERTQGELNLI